MAVVYLVVWRNLRFTGCPATCFFLYLTHPLSSPCLSLLCLSPSFLRRRCVKTIQVFQFSFIAARFPSSPPNMNVSCSAAVIITVSCFVFFPSCAAHSSTLCLSFGDVPLVCAGGSKVPLAGSRSWLITFSSRRLSPKMSLKKTRRRRSRKRK